MRPLETDARQAASGDEQDAAYRDALSFLYDRINYERMASGTSRYPFRLQRMRRLLELLGLGHFLYRPDVSATVPLVHIAGTKGKGSTASLVAAGLTASGLKTGLYTSPHLNDLEERFRVDGACCEHECLVELVGRLRSSVRELGEDLPSFFELTTALALLHFQQQACDAVVLEVGLGGRLDSTNVCAPLVTSITSIGLDHQHVLGDTIEAIAAEKAGIIKKDVPVVSGVRSDSARAVITAMAAENGAQVCQIGNQFSYRSSRDVDWGSSVEYQWDGAQSRSQTFSLGLEGEHQAGNAAIAMAILDVLAERGIEVSTHAAAEAFGTVQCPARLERFRLSKDRVAVVDAAHNVDSIAALVACLKNRFDDRRITVVFGTSRDKNAAAMLSLIAEVADHLVLTQFASNPRFREASALKQLTPESTVQRTTVIADPIEACQFAYDRIGDDGVMVVCGSFFLVAETRPWVVERSLRS